MNEPRPEVYLQIVLLLAFIIPFIFFLLTQQRTLELIRPENRHMPPGQVWLQLIPVIGLFWQFSVIKKMSESIRDELNTPIEDSVFGESSFPLNQKPTYNAGVLYAILYCVSILPIPLFNGVAAFIGLGAWINYWIQLARCKKQLKERALLVQANR